MKLSRRWCANFIVGEFPPSAALAERLTAFGFEVDAVSPAGAVDGDIVAGRVVSCVKHPNADLLRVCEVDVGASAPSTIVCGAPNVRTDMQVAVALPGTQVADIKIAQRAIRGVDSAGMLCSASELGLGRDADEIIELSVADGVFAAGESMSEALLLNDDVLEVGVTPNRGDCLSHLGMAREIAAFIKAAVTSPTELANAETDNAFPVELQAPAACPYYGSLLMHGVDCSRPSPWWLRSSIERCGGRSISAVVDVTNYLMLAFGQPLHVFDADKLSGGIIVRHAAAGEALQLLDGTQAICDADDLLIADGNGGVALAGVMGGMESSSTTQTRNILLEAAFFSSVAVRGKARKFNLSSDAAFRFERGVDSALPAVALTHAAALIQRLCGGQIGKASLVGKPPTSAAPVRVSLAKTSKVLGVEMSADETVELLNRFALPTTVANEELSVKAPSWRFDIKSDIDVIEEVARAWGYDNLPETLPATGRVFSPATQAAADEARLFFAAHGFFEVVTYSFVPTKWEHSLSLSPSLPLQNPLSEEMAVMRTTLWGGLLDRAAFNARHRQARVCLFEIGRCFFSQVSEDNSLPKQPMMLAGVATGLANTPGWVSNSRPVDFYDVKGVLEAFLALFVDIRFSACSSLAAAFHPGKAADIICGDICVGRLGELHPAQAWAAEFTTPPVLFEINLDLLSLLKTPSVAVAPISYFPSVSRDLAVVIDKSLPVGDLLACARRAAPMPPVTEVRLFDFYQGLEDNASCGCGLRLFMQGGKDNLTSDDIERVTAKVLTAIQQECNAVLRG